MKIIILFHLWWRYFKWVLHYCCAWGLARGHVTNILNVIFFQRINWIVKPEVYTDHSSSYFNSKCIHSTQTALVVNNHAPKMCLSPVKGMTSDNCILHVDPELGYTHHHRESCCEQAHLPHQQEFLRKLFKRDRTILRYMKKLSKNSNKVWNSIFQS